MSIASSARRRRGLPRGFTIVELLVAIILLGVGVLATVGMIAAGSRRQRLAESRSELTALAESKIEQLRGATRSRTSDTLQVAIGGSLASDMAAHADTVVSTRGRTYLRRWEVVAGPAGTRQATLRIVPGSTFPNEMTRLEFVTLFLID